MAKMQISRLCIKNFRGIQDATIFLPKHAVLVGDNNVGKTTILEAIDLVLGPDRLSRIPPIDEHDFYEGKYQNKESNNETEEMDNPEIADEQKKDDVMLNQSAPKITIEATITDLTDEQIRKFGDYIEWWDKQNKSFYDKPNPEGVDGEYITEALRVSFIGYYDPEEDDFKGKTYLTRTLYESGTPQSFSTRDKQYCGFLYLRSLRTGSRALSMERGSLLDIIMRLKEIRPKMWEDILSRLSSFNVASDPESNVSGVLESINKALQKFVPKEWGQAPHLKVSNLTREHLRKVITAFIANKDGQYATPFYRQGTGTINVLVLAMLSIIAEEKQNVIFAMEEPETAIPPYAQKRIVDCIRNLSSQSIFTSHSPYVIEEFTPEEAIILSRDPNGSLKQKAIDFPESIKLKRYRQEFRTRFCEGLLASRILITEGCTEATSLPVVARRLAELNPNDYASLESLGICTIDAGGQSNIADLCELYRKLEKKVFAVCDKQTDEDKAKIEARVERLFMHEEKGFENLVLAGTTAEAMKRFLDSMDLPQHIKTKYPNPKENVKEVLHEYFCWAKGDWGIADFLAQCSENEIPEWIREMCISLKELCEIHITNCQENKEEDSDGEVLDGD